MNDDKNKFEVEEFWIEWEDPADDLKKYFALSPETGHYWTTDVNDPCIVNGAELDIIYSPEDTMKQIGEKWKLKKGAAYERHNLFKHPSPGIHAWLAVEKKPTGERDGENKVIRKFKAFYSRKFKSVVCISRLTGQRQGNPQMQDKDYARKSSAKAKEERKRRLENIEKASKRLHFNPAEQLIAWAQGDDSKLNTSEPIKNSQRIKALEILASYTWAKPKPVDHAAIERQKQGNQGPVVHVTLPSNSRELDKHVLKHDDQESLDSYFKNTYKEPDEVAELDEEAGDYDEDSGLFIPSNNRED